MGDDDRNNESTPRSEWGLDIPIPTRDDFVRTLEKIVAPERDEQHARDAT